MTIDRNLLGYCGLYCGDCPGHTGTIADLAKDLRKELRRVKFDKVAEVIPLKEFKHYKETYETLGAMLKLRCKRTCRGDGGPPRCNIRKCCKKKNFDGCWECDQFADCSKLEVLEILHKDAHQKNLRNIRRNGVETFLSGKRYW